MKHTPIEHIKKKSISGVIAFTIRTFFLQIISLIATIFLAAFLSPEDFGVYYLVTSIVNIFIFLSDIGLAASLVQKKSEPDIEDLKTTFTVQQILSLGIFIVIILMIPVWRRYLDLSAEGVSLLIALGFSFILASLKTIPSILLERELEFNKLVIPQIFENLTFYLVVVAMAWKGYGVTSYTYGVILRGLVGLLTIYYIKPWRPTLGISKKSLKHLLKFGLPFQINDFLARIKDDLLLVTLKRLLSNTEIGYLGWAQRWSMFPFRFTVDSVIRVTFPAFSRLQHDKETLKKAIEKSVFFIALIIFPLLFGMGAIAYPVTLIIEKYQKWQPAIPALYLFLINVSFASVSTPIINALNALGHIKLTLRIMVFWTALTWVLTLTMVQVYGFIGAALAAALVSVTSLVTIYYIQKIVEVKILRNLFPQLVSAFGMLIFLLLIREYSDDSVPHLLITIVIGGLVYFGLIFVILRDKLISELKLILNK